MSEKKLSYKPGIACVLWAVVVLMHGRAMMPEIQEIFGADSRLVAAGIVFLVFALFLTGVSLIVAVMHQETYQENLVHFSEQNEKHLCPNCAKLLNDNKLRISRVTA